jgi:hypothetical protein
MTKKDYEMVAKVIKYSPTYAGIYMSREILIVALCEAFKRDNIQFNCNKFKETCERGEE